MHSCHTLLLHHSSTPPSLLHHSSITPPTHMRSHILSRRHAWHEYIRKENTREDKRYSKTTTKEKQHQIYIPNPQSQSRNRVIPENMVKITSPNTSSTNAPKVLKNASVKDKSSKAEKIYLNNNKITERQSLVYSMHEIAYELYKRSFAADAKRTVSVTYLEKAKNIKFEVKIILCREKQEISFETSLTNIIGNGRTVCVGVHGNMSKKEFFRLIGPRIKIAIDHLNNVLNILL